MAAVPDSSSTSRWARSSSGPLLAAGATVAIGASRVADRSYWMDEAATRMFVDRPFSGLVSLMWREEAAMGPYFVALWLWQHAFPSDSGMRMFSVLGGAIAAGLVVAIGRRWFDGPTAGLACLLLVVNPFFLRYLTELRAYSWVMVLSLSFGWLVLEWSHRPDRRLSAGLGVTAGVAVATHYFFALWVVAVCAGLVAVGAIGRRHAAPLVRAGAIGLAVVAPFLHVLTRRSNQVDWIGPITVDAISDTASDLLGGRLPGAVLLTGLALMFLAAAALVWSRAPVGLQGDEAGAAPTDDRGARVVVLSMALGGPLLLLAVSFVQSFMIARYFAPAFPFIALAAASGFVRSARKLSSTSAVAVVVAAVSIVSVAAFVDRGPFDDENRWSDPRAAVEFVLARLEPGDVIAIDRDTRAILHYLGARPDIDPAWMGPAVDTRSPPRRPFSEIADVYESAPRVFVFGWNEAPSQTIDALRPNRTSERFDFGLTWVVIVD